jgi:iron complex transport system ATP-binding protein
MRPAPAHPSPILAADQLSFQYPTGRFGTPRPVLDRIDLSIDQGDLVAILGPNGSGKTTLLKLLNGMYTATSGRVRLDGRPLAETSRRARARRMAFVPQETSAAFDYSVLDVVLMGRYPHLGPFELEQPDDVAVAWEALEATGTAALADRSFATLSGGERQRVMIAGALAQTPELLLLDEPTASLDIGAELEVVALLDSLNRARGLTIVLSTHDLNFAGRLCRQTALLSQGCLLAYGATADVLTSAAIRSLYGVEAEVRVSAPDRRVIVTPMGRAS